MNDVTDIKKKDAACVLFILMVGLTCINWFKGECLIDPTDFSYQVNPLFDFYSRRFVWSNLSFYDWRGTGHLIVFFIPFLLYKIGFSIYTSEKIIFYVLYCLSGIGGYYAVRSVLGSHLKYSVASSLLASNFYMINPVVMSSLWNSTGINMMYLYSVSPLIVVFFIKSLQTQKVKYAIYFAFAILWASPSIASPPTFVATMLFLSALFISYCYLNKSMIKKYCRVVIICLGITLLINMFWFIFYTDLSLSGQTFTEAKKIIAGHFTTWRASSFLNILRFIPHMLIQQSISMDWNYIPTRAMEPYFYWWAHYYNNVFFILAFALLTIVYLVPPFFIGVFKHIYNVEQRLILVVSVLLMILYIFLAKGTYQPFGEFYEWLLNEVPGFIMFRSPEKFLCPSLITFLFIIGFSSNIIMYKLSPALVKYYVIFMFLIANIYTFPMWTGGFTPNIARMKIPDYYYSLSKKVNDNYINSRVLILPDLTSTWTGGYAWEQGFMGLDVLVHLVEKKYMFVVNPADIYANNSIESLYAIYNTDLNRFIDVFLKYRYFLSVNQIILHYDIDQAMIKTSYIAEDISRTLNLKSNANILETTDGNLKLYKFADVIPVIYTVEKLYVAQSK
ncbi:MAG: hypothetical protein HQK94_18610 [Nitrospirae bacterium]|nr:hypothetical protein [Nitrospirota bacterium]